MNPVKAHSAAKTHGREAWLIRIAKQLDLRSRLLHADVQTVYEKDSFLGPALLHGTSLRCRIAETNIVRLLCSPEMSGVAKPLRTARKKSTGGALSPHFTDSHFQFYRLRALPKALI
jgi:hypothetical protein